MGPHRPAGLGYMTQRLTGLQSHSSKKVDPGSYKIDFTPKLRNAARLAS